MKHSKIQTTHFVCYFYFKMFNLLNNWCQNMLQKKLWRKMKNYCFRFVDLNFSIWNILFIRGNNAIYHEKIHAQTFRYILVLLDQLLLLLLLLNCNVIHLLSWCFTINKKKNQQQHNIKSKKVIIIKWHNFDLHKIQSARRIKMNKK